METVCEWTQTTKKSLENSILKVYESCLYGMYEALKVFEVQFVGFGGSPCRGHNLRSCCISESCYCSRELKWSKAVELIANFFEASNHKIQQRGPLRGRNTRPSCPLCHRDSRVKKRRGKRTGARSLAAPPAGLELARPTRRNSGGRWWITRVWAP